MHQIGFLRQRSFVTQLLPVIHAFGQSLDKNIQTDIVYLHFAKAFDSVDHQILLQKLKSYGVRSQLYKWFVDYLNGRYQRMVIDGASSHWAPVTSGVAQGGIFGPILRPILRSKLHTANQVHSKLRDLTALLNRGTTFKKKR